MLRENAGADQSKFGDQTKVLQTKAPKIHSQKRQMKCKMRFADSFPPQTLIFALQCISDEFFIWTLCI